MEELKIYFESTLGVNVGIKPVEKEESILLQRLKPVDINLNHLK